MSSYCIMTTHFTAFILYHYAHIYAVSVGALQLLFLLVFKTTDMVVHYGSLIVDSLHLTSSQNVIYTPTLFNFLDSNTRLVNKQALFKQASRTTLSRRSSQYELPGKLYSRALSRVTVYNITDSASTSQIFRTPRPSITNITQKII